MIPLGFLQLLNTDKVFYAITMLSMNLGSRYVIQDISKLQEKVLASTVCKRFVLFCMLFVATRDIMTAVILTFGVVCLLQYFLNENSTLCILPNTIFNPIASATHAYTEARKVQ
jgi:hypothetical protein